MPQVDEWHETDTPGLFLAGEVGGLALVRNAMSQGRRVVERIARAATGRSVAGDDGRGRADRRRGTRRAWPRRWPAPSAASPIACSSRRPDLGGSLLHYPRRKMVLLQPVELPLHGRIDQEEFQKEHFLELMEGLVRAHSLDVRFCEKAQERAAARRRRSSR